MFTIQTKWLVIGALILSLVLGVAAYAGYRLWVSSQTAKIENKLSDNQTQAAVANGKDSLDTFQNRTTTETHIDKEVRDITNVIRNDPSPARQYDPALYNASISWMCKQAGDQSDPKCVQQPATQ